MPLLQGRRDLVVEPVLGELLTLWDYGSAPVVAAEVPTGLGTMRKCPTGQRAQIARRRAMQRRSISPADIADGRPRTS
jgi:hypothetical protein